MRAGAACRTTPTARTRDSPINCFRQPKRARARASMASSGLARCPVQTAGDGELRRTCGSGRTRCQRQLYRRLSPRAPVRPRYVVILSWIEPLFTKNQRILFLVITTNAVLILPYKSTILKKIRSSWLLIRARTHTCIMNVLAVALSYHIVHSHNSQLTNQRKLWSTMHGSETTGFVLNRNLVLAT